MEILILIIAVTYLLKPSNNFNKYGGVYRVPPTKSPPPNPPPKQI